MRVLNRALLIFLALLLVGPVAVAHARYGYDAHGAGSLSAKKKRHARPSAVAVKVSAGYDEQYRATAWMPVRVWLRNRTASTLSGTVDLPVYPSTNPGPPQAGRALYQQAVVLPGGSRKQLTFYVPASTGPNEVDAIFRGDGRVLGRGASYPSAFGDNGLLIATLATDPVSVHWVRAMSLNSVGELPIDLSIGTLDAVPQALATFDVIVLSNIDASGLSAAQKAALLQWVQNGGSLVEVGGPDWQETLRSLPSSLLPGRITGSTRLSDLSGLAQGKSAPPRLPATVSVLAQPHGAVLARHGGTPLVVRQALGAGGILYLAFDPALDPIAHWRGASSFLNTLIRQSSPQAMTRAALPSSYSSQQFGYMGSFGPANIVSELTNVPAAALPSLVLFVLLTIGFILLIGPINFLVLRRLRRRELAWVSVPALAAICVGSTFGVAFHLKGNTVLINSVGMIELNGDGGPSPATFYSGLFAPVRGDYHLTYGAPALPEIVPQYFFWGPGPTGSGNPLTMSFQEGRQTSITFLSMNMWSMREVALHTTVQMSGSISSDLHPDARGYLVGTIHNTTSLNLIRPIALAGRKTTRLPDLPAGATIHVRIHPAINPHDHRPLALSLYGQPRYGGPMMGGFRFFPGPGIGGGGFGVFGGPCCGGPPQPDEKNLADRIRNVADSLPETQSLSNMGEVAFIGWTEQSLGTMSVDGTTPHRRDLTMVAAPLSVHLAPGTFRLLRGALTAKVIDLAPGVASTGCCPWGPWTQPIDIGTQGHGIFAFDLPASGRIHLRDLHVWVDAGGPSGYDIGSVYDWPQRRWVKVDLSSGGAALKQPDRFVSSGGRVLLRLQPTDVSGDVVIADPHQNLQISGSGWVA